jgi:hypothetical protein
MTKNFRNKIVGGLVMKLIIINYGLLQEQKERKQKRWGKKRHGLAWSWLVVLIAGWDCR